MLFGTISIPYRVADGVEVLNLPRRGPNIELELRRFGH